MLVILVLNIVCACYVWNQRTRFENEWDFRLNYEHAPSAWIRISLEWSHWYDIFLYKNEKSWTRVDSLRWFPNVVAQRHILGCAPRGLWPSNSNSQEIFVQCTHPTSFIILCLLVRRLSCWQTNKRTHKQTNRRRWKHPTLFATLRRWLKIKFSQLRYLTVLRFIRCYEFTCLFAVTSSQNGSSFRGPSTRHEDRLKDRCLTGLMWPKVRRTWQWLGSSSSLHSTTRGRRICCTGWEISKCPTSTSFRHSITIHRWTYLDLLLVSLSHGRRSIRRK